MTATMMPPEMLANLNVSIYPGYPSRAQLIPTTSPNTLHRLLPSSHIPMAPTLPGRFTKSVLGSQLKFDGKEAMAQFSRLMPASPLLLYVLSSIFIFLQKYSIPSVRSKKNGLSSPISRTPTSKSPTLFPQTAVLKLL